MTSSCCSTPTTVSEAACCTSEAVQDLPVAVLGAGPVGLAAAAHLLERGLTPLVFEQGVAVGAYVRDWAHVRMFSPWRYNLDAAAGRLLEAAGHRLPDPDHLPTGAEVVDDYLAPFAALPAVRPHLHLNTRVVAVGREGADKVKSTARDARPFVVHTRAADGTLTRHRVRAVLDATGTWGTPNPAGADGLPAPGEAETAAHLRYGLPDVLGRERDRYAGRHTLVVGSGHSAFNVLLDLARLRDEVPGTHITWAVRRADASSLYGGGTADQLPARGALGKRLRRLVRRGVVEVAAPFHTQAFHAVPEGVAVEGASGQPTLVVDEVVAATGARPDLAMLREIRLDLDPATESPTALAPLIDPNVHSCGTVRPHGEAVLRHLDAGFYLVGVKSYGRAPTFLLATGYEQVRSIAAALSGDWEAARAVHLNLPETGVCSTDLGVPEEEDEQTEASICCGAPGTVAEALPLLASATPGCGC